MGQVRKAGGYAFVVHDDATLALLDRFFISMGAMIDHKAIQQISKLEK